ncbi:MAG: DUF3054 domain-containing protein [Actinomycetota bacterium]|nr:DUF3054 domain-containing protein [Actinomycetota bacterium]
MSWRAGVADVVAVLVFAAAGRRTHTEAGALLGLLGTAGPFLVALGVGWVIARAWRRPLAVRTALVVWPVTVVGGLALRAAFTGRLPLSFAVVTAVALGVLLLGWRVAVAVTARRRRTVGR